MEIMETMEIMERETMEIMERSCMVVFFGCWLFALPRNMAGMTVTTLIMVISAVHFTLGLGFLLCCCVAGRRDASSDARFSLRPLGACSFLMLYTTYIYIDT